MPQNYFAIGLTNIKIVLSELEKDIIDDFEIIKQMGIE